MTWEQRLSALMALTRTALRMRKPGDWYVSAEGREIGGDGLLRSVHGEGISPEEAVNRDWEQVTDLSAQSYVQTAKGRFRWSGYMWDPVPGEDADTPGGA